MGLRCGGGGEGCGDGPRLAPFRLGRFSAGIVIYVGTISVYMGNSNVRFLSTSYVYMLRICIFYAD